MVHSAKGNKQIHSLSPEEYDFSVVPEEELECCLYYEYMRESEAIIREVKKLRRQIVNKRKRQDLKIGDLLHLKLTHTKVTNHPKTFEVVMLLQLATARMFPDAPWRKLSNSDKEDLLNFPWKARRSEEKVWLKAFPPLVIETLNKDPSLGESTLDAWITKQKQGYVTVSCSIAQKHLASAPKGFFVTGAPLTKFFEPGFFQINLNYDQEVLIDAFRDWLKANHPTKGEEVVVERRGRRGQRDALNALGALRLRFHCRTLNEAQKLIAPLALKPKAIHYSDRTAWKRACDAAVTHFRKLLRLPDRHLPRHFTKGWQK